MLEIGTAVLQPYAILVQGLTKFLLISTLMLWNLLPCSFLSVKSPRSLHMFFFTAVNSGHNLALTYQYGYFAARIQRKTPRNAELC